MRKNEKPPAMQVGPRAYSDLPPFLFWLEGKMEQVILKNINNYL